MPFHTTADRTERTARLLGIEAGVRGVALPDDVADVFLEFRRRGARSPSGDTR